MTKDTRVPILIKRITADTTEGLDVKFRAWMKEWRFKIEMLDQRWDTAAGGPLWVEIDYCLLLPIFVRILPFKTVQPVIDEEEEGEIGLWQSGENVCEYKSDASGECAIIPDRITARTKNMNRGFAPGIFTETSFSEKTRKVD